MCIYSNRRMNPALRHVGARQPPAKSQSKERVLIVTGSGRGCGANAQAGRWTNADPNYEVGKERQEGDGSQHISMGRARKPAFAGIRDASIGAKLFKHEFSQPSRTAIDVRRNVQLQQFSEKWIDMNIFKSRNCRASFDARAGGHKNAVHF